MNAKEEEKRLTELGRRQAEATGQRLKELELPYTKMCVSTVVRARETADLGRTRTEATTENEVNVQTPNECQQKVISSSQ